MDGFLRRMLSVLFAVVIGVYIGYQIYQSTYTSVEVANAVSYTVYDTIDTDAFIVRDETVISAVPNGYVYYTLENGDRVAKGGEIARVFPSESDALTRQKLDRLESQISALQAAESLGNYNRTNLDLINAQLDDTLRSLILAGRDRRYSGLSDTQFQLLQLFCKQQLTTGVLTDLEPTIDALKAERQALSADFSPATSSIASPVAGYFISRTDGLERAVEYARVTEATPEQVGELLKKTGSASADGIGKVAGDYQWYLLCVLNKEQVSGVGVGSRLSVKLPFVSADSVPVTVAAVNKDREGNAAVVLQCIYMSEKLAAVRQETVQIQLKAYTGLYVQDSALHFNDKNEPGVFVRVGNTCLFRRVEVLYHSETGKYSVCAADGGDGFLKLYDDVIVKGKGLYDGKIIR